MSQTSTYNLVAGTPKNIVSPTSVSSWANAVIINLTTGTLYLNVGGSPLTLPQLQSIQVKNPGMTANLTATATVSGTLEVIWYFQGEVVPTTVPVTATDITVNGPVDITGPVSVYTSGADLVSTATAYSAQSGSVSSVQGGGIPYFGPGALPTGTWRGVIVYLEISATAGESMPVSIYGYTNGTDLFTRTLTSIAPIGYQLVGSAVIPSNETEIELAVDLSAYSSADLFGFNYFYILSSVPFGDPTASEVLNRISGQLFSTVEGVAVADSLAPADSSFNNNSVAVTGGTTIGLTTFDTAVIVRSVFVSWITTANTGRVTIAIGNWASSIYAANQQEPAEFVRGGGVYVPAGSTMSIYADNTDTFVVSASYTTL